MGKSYSYYKEEVKEYIINRFKNREIRILDVGAGEGTYYNLLGKYYKNIDAVEVFMGNIKKYELEKKDQTVYNENIIDFRYEWYDLIIFGDVIEHLEVEEAQKVLEYAYDRCIEMIIAVPYMYKQGEVYGNKYEIHKQDDLSKENVIERYPYLELLYGNDEYGYYIKK